MTTDKFPLLNNIKMNIVSPPQVKYIPRALLYTCLILLQLPFHWLELFLFKRKIESYKLKHDPIIILGYWRSGTTYLQRLLCINPEIAYLTQYEAFLPLGSAIHSKLFKPLLNWAFRILKIKHPSHGVFMDMNFPSEEDIALISASYSNTPMWSHIYSNRADYYFQKLLISEEGSEDFFSFRKMYQYLLKKLSYLNNGRQLVLKSPSNTTKIPEILSIFPNAKFVYIKRNINDVYFSNIKLLSNNRHQWLQVMKQHEMTEFFISSYPRVISHYNKTKSIIPAQNLVEIEFEKLCENPKNILREIVSKFNIRHFEKYEMRVNQFLENNHLKEVSRYSGDLPPQVRQMFEQLHLNKLVTEEKCVV
jgi:omega-hydroxy-beta-dihydromenaquinone-9 sulfotransferase